MYSCAPCPPSVRWYPCPGCWWTRHNQQIVPTEMPFVLRGYILISGHSCRGRGSSSSRSSSGGRVGNVSRGCCSSRGISIISDAVNAAPVMLLMLTRPYLWWYPLAMSADAQPSMYSMCHMIRVYVSHDHLPVYLTVARPCKQTIRI